MRVGYALVLNDDVGGEGFTGSDGVMGEAKRSDKDLVRVGCGGAFFFKCEDVDVEDAFAVIAVLEEVGSLLGLLIVLVVLRHQGVSAEPAVRSEFAFFRARIVRAR